MKNTEAKRSEKKNTEAKRRKRKRKRNEEFAKRKEAKKFMRFFCFEAKRKI